MSSCKVCHLDVKKHSKKLWALHQQAQICTFCQKNASEHSEKLWKMHKIVTSQISLVNKGNYMENKIDIKKEWDTPSIKELSIMMTFGGGSDVENDTNSTYGPTSFGNS